MELLDTKNSISRSLSDVQRNNFRLWLQRELINRCKRNNKYSLRAFAQFIQIDASTVSQILSGKRNVSRAFAKRICEKISATPRELVAFGLAPSTSGSERDYLSIESETFSAIADWYHYAILELTFVSGFKSDPKWIAQKLAITVEEAKAATARLERLGLLQRKNGTVIKSSKATTNQSKVATSAAHKELQRQVISKALLAVDEVALEAKDISSMTIAVSEKNLGLARNLIQKFRREICDLLEDGKQTQVYHLGVQLYPVSTHINKENL